MKQGEYLTAYVLMMNTVGKVTRLLGLCTRSIAHVADSAIVVSTENVAKAN